jgi:hypothetical protein
MKKTLLSIFICSFFLTTVNAQDPAQAVWSLLTDTSSSVTGNISAAPQFTSPLLVPKIYGSSYDGGASTGWQRKGAGQIFPSPYDATVYDEYKVKPLAGNTLKVTQISFSALGGGTGNMRVAVYYSKDGFATYDSLSAGSLSGGSGAAYNNTTYRATAVEPIVLLNTSTTGLAGKEVVTFPSLNININAGDSLVIRTLPFLSSSTTSTRYYPTKQFSITGTTTAAILPVTFSGTKVFQKNNGVQVDWTSFTEVNLSKYVVERSVDGSTFIEAGTVGAQGNTTVATNYSWYDASPYSGNNLYRIKAVDKDGHATYTTVVKITLGKKSFDFAVAPNPVKNKLINVQISNLTQGSYNLNVYNAVGQQVYSRSINHDGGSATYQLQLPGSVKAGMYTLQLREGEKVINKKVVVE